MAGRVQHVKGSLAQRERVAFARGRINIRAIRWFHAEPSCLHFQAVIQLLVFGVHIDRSPRGGLELRRAANVIDVRMSDHDGLHGKLVPRKHRKNFIDLVARVDDDSLTRPFVAKDRAVALQHSNRENLVNHLSLGLSWGLSWSLSIGLSRGPTCAGGLNSSVLKTRNGSPGGATCSTSATWKRGPWK